MIAYMNEKGRQTKLLAAIAVLAMVVCALVVVMPSENTSATPVTPQTAPFGEPEGVATYEDGVYTVTNAFEIDISDAGMNLGTASAPLDIRFDIQAGGSVNFTNDANDVRTVYIQYVADPAAATSAEKSVFHGVSGDENTDLTVGQKVVLDLEISLSSDAANSNNHIFTYIDAVLTAGTAASGQAAAIPGGSIIFTQAASVNGTSWYTGSLEANALTTVTLDAANGINEVKMDMNGATMNIVNPNESTISPIAGSTIANTTITGNGAGANGAIFFDGNAAITNSTIDVGTADVRIGEGTAITLDEKSSITAGELQSILSSTGNDYASITGGTINANITHGQNSGSMFMMNDVTLTGDIEITKGVTIGTQSGHSLTVDAAANVINNGTVNMNGTLVNKGSFTGNSYEGSGTVEYYAGSTVEINNSIYHVFETSFTLENGTSITMYYGITVPDIVYNPSNETVDVQDIEPEATPLQARVNGEINNTVSMSTSFEPSQSTMVGEASGDVGEYMVRVAVNLGVSYTEGDVTQSSSKYAYGNVTFNVIGAEPEITLDMDGWNVNVPGASANANPTFQYNGIDGESYTEADFPGEVIYTLTYNGTEYAQANWSKITEPGTYTLTAEFPAVGNNRAATATCEVTIISGTEPSPFVPGDVEEQYIDDLLGKKVSDLQGQLTFTETGNTNEFVVSGMVRHLDSYEGFWGGAGGHAGYYFAFTINEGMDIDWSKVTITLTTGAETKYFGPEAADGALTDGTFVLYLGNDAKTLSATFTFTIDIDGDGTLYKATTYKVLTSATVDGTKYALEPFTYSINYIDSMNDHIIEVTNVAEGAEYHINYAGAGAGFTGWATEVVEGDTPRHFNFGSQMIVSPAFDVDGDGIIELTAQYGSTPVQPGETDPATNIKLFIAYDADGNVDVMIYGTDGYVPGYSITIHYSYSIMVGDRLVTINDETEVVTGDNADRSAIVIENIGLPMINETGTVIGAYASVTMGDITMTSDTIAHTAASA